MKTFLKGRQSSFRNLGLHGEHNQPRTPLRLKSNAAPTLFSLRVFYVL